DADACAPARPGDMGDLTDANAAAGGGGPTTPDLVVGLGASAGGLEALQSFFSALPPDTGLTYVVVQHLDPNTESLLPGLLSKVTSVPVAEATNGTSLAANHIYIAPPKGIVRVEENVLRVTPAAAADEQRGPINALFFSLADSRQTAAVAIV